MIGGSDLVNAMRTRREQMRPKDGSDDEYVVKTAQPAPSTRGPDYVERRISELKNKIANLGKLDAQLKDLNNDKAAQDNIVKDNTKIFGENKKAKTARTELSRLATSINSVQKEIASREAKIAEHNADIAELETLTTDKQIKEYLTSKIQSFPNNSGENSDGFFRYDIQTARKVLDDMNKAAIAAAALPPSIVDIHPIALLADAIERAACGTVLTSLDHSLSANICASILVSSIKSTANVDLGGSIYSNNAKDYGGLFAAVQATKVPASSSSSSSSSSTSDLSESKLNAKNLLIKVLDSNEGKVREFFTTLLKANNSALIVNLMTTLEAGEIEKAYANAKALIGMGMPEDEFTQNLQDLGISEWYTEQKTAEINRMAAEAAAELQRQQQLEAQRQAAAKRLADEEADRQRLAEAKAKKQVRKQKHSAYERGFAHNVDEDALKNFFSETLEDENSRNSTKAYNTKLEEAERQRKAEEIVKAERRNKMLKIVGATIFCGALVAAGVYLYRNPKALSEASTALNSYCSKAKDSSFVKSVKEYCSKACAKISDAFRR